MIKIEQLKSMEFNYFEAPNKIIQFDRDLITLVVAELENINIDKDFCIDQKTFNMLNKLKTNRVVKVENNDIVIKSKEGKFKSRLVETPKPRVEIDNAKYECEYDLDILKNATKFVSKSETRPILSGVLFNEKGGVAATDSFKVYAYKDIDDLLYSIPISFIELLKPNKDNKVKLSFNNNTIIYNGNYKVISRAYAGSIPNIEVLIKRIREDISDLSLISKTNEFSFFPSDIIDLSFVGKELTLTFADNENEFKIFIELENALSDDIDFRFNYNHLMTAFSLFDNKLELGLPKSNLKPILIERGLEKIIVLPMRITND